MTDDKSAYDVLMWARYDEAGVRVKLDDLLRPIDPYTNALHISVALYVSDDLRTG